MMFLLSACPIPKDATFIVCKHFCFSWFVEFWLPFLYAPVFFELHWDSCRTA